ncbi:hypothetical protein [Actomonas aquatica]|uniref:Lipocalin-like domain-containing protein n=1 Tax=Actomonas aquatica TaxID=2866162 RepID=A0ABZ1C435_9BACT|nr:hypothetical protein [Opitutus sp. WL0086]WRQ86058.1 hypothetical protein K1X11_014685 [Opitutus sp. WL0086]
MNLLRLPARPLALLALLALTSTLFAATAPSPALTGTWTFDADRSTDLSPWRTATLEITLDGSDLVIARTLKSGRRTFTDSLTIDLSAPSTTNPLEWWVDNRHLGAYAPHEGTQVVSPSVYDDGRVLRLNIDYNLETQQGSRPVNTLRQFQISPDGQVLTVTDLRTTRPRPVVHVFQRSSE